MCGPGNKRECILEAYPAPHVYDICVYVYTYDIYIYIDTDTHVME